MSCLYTQLLNALIKPGFAYGPGSHCRRLGAYRPTRACRCYYSPPAPTRLFIACAAARLPPSPEVSPIIFAMICQFTGCSRHFPIARPPITGSCRHDWQNSLLSPASPGHAERALRAGGHFADGRGDTTAGLPTRPRRYHWPARNAERRPRFTRCLELAGAATRSLIFFWRVIMRRWLAYFSDDTAQNISPYLLQRATARFR